MPIVPYDANLPSDVALDSGTFIHGNAVPSSCTLLGATRGGLRFDSAETIEAYDFDGRDAPIKGTHRKFYGEAKFSATLIVAGPAASGNQIAKLEPGSTSADSGSTPNTLHTITPPDGRVPYVAGNYLTYLRAVWRRGIAAGAGVKSYFAVAFPVAVCTKWSLAGTDKNLLLFDVEFSACLDMASGTTAKAPFLIEYIESMP